MHMQYVQIFQPKPSSTDTFNRIVDSTLLAEEMVCFEVNISVEEKNNPMVYVFKTLTASNKNYNIVPHTNLLSLIYGACNK